MDLIYWSSAFHAADDAAIPDPIFYYLFSFSHQWRIIYLSIRSVGDWTSHEEIEMIANMWRWWNVGTVTCLLQLENFLFFVFCFLSFFPTLFLFLSFHCTFYHSEGVFRFQGDRTLCISFDLTLADGCTDYRRHPVMDLTVARNSTHPIRPVTSWGTLPVLMLTDNAHNYSKVTFPRSCDRLFITLFSLIPASTSNESTRHPGDIN